MYQKISIIILLIVTTLSCNDTDPISAIDRVDSFDRSEMLSFWADEIIIPAYMAYANDLSEMDETAKTFFADPSASNLEKLRESWLEAYISWQSVSLFEIGKAEEIGLHNYTNIYPTNIELIHSNISNNNYNLILPSNFAAQGFPALDYLLYGIEDTEEGIVSTLSKEDVRTYAISLIERLYSITTEVLDHWTESYRSEFVANDGSSGTASVDKVVNDFLFFYEKYLRAAKIGIPAGKFSGSKSSRHVEGFYSEKYSKLLFQRAFTSVKDFFNGISYDGQRRGTSIKQYLDQIQNISNSDIDYSGNIISQWNVAQSAADALDSNFKTQVEEDNTKMLAVYDELQKAIVLLKVDMMQALNIQVDFVDADGD